MGEAVNATPVPPLPVVCADCGAACFANGCATGYAITSVPSLDNIPFADRSRTVGDRTYPARYDVEALHPECKAERRICYACAAILETETMIATGRTCLYLSEQKANPATTQHGLRFRRTAIGTYYYTYKLAGWPGSPSFRILSLRESQGYGFGRRYPVRTFRFAGPDGFVWSGRCAGDMELARCKRTKEALPC